MSELLADHIIALEDEQTRLLARIEENTVVMDQAAARIEALEAALARVARVDNSLAEQLSRSMAINAGKTKRIEALEAVVRKITNPDRPTKKPGGMQCQRCDSIFIGDETHTLCGICAALAPEHKP